MAMMDLERWILNSLHAFPTSKVPKFWLFGHVMPICLFPEGSKTHGFWRSLGLGWCRQAPHLWTSCGPPRSEFFYGGKGPVKRVQGWISGGGVA